ncbi:N utilization substance protein B [Paenibacillus baekrokdamisoli]|uniref:Transcription antitermination protein NusB n=1 Tax=Paenibacillus baekrokdamisoli TaxID=1712516 RepID=A0A3G9JB81_9BACL|nr:transcription antitermination factor NusB [Paenibacillus baekrokdamisoli]MBB3070096.1 N utilization substance protein B [Paenibacillus baekrokdamisoli]BBH21108.1 N utilization substance protein B [Paenibacillus baekrokdamisoli]
MKRRLAREIVVQSLYQMEMNEDATAEDAVSMIIDEVNEENEIEANAADVSRIDQHVRAMVLEVSEKKAAIDDMLQDYLTGWQVDRLSRVDRQILRLACFELVFKDDVPPKAVINEAIELAKHFGTEESGKFVNGVLGRLLQALDQLKPKA